MSIHSEPMELRSPTLHATILFTILVFAAIVLMSIIFKVEVVARGEGRVVPVSRVQVVQPEVSGRVEAIHVRNGDAVAQGDILIELDATSAVSDLRTNIADQQRLLIERARVGSDTFSLRPGMTATVDVTTDERRIITYFFAPIVRTIQDAMGER